MLVNGITFLNQPLCALFRPDLEKFEKNAWFISLEGDHLEAVVNGKPHFEKLYQYARKLKDALEVDDNNVVLFKPVRHLTENEFTILSEETSKSTNKRMTNKMIHFVNLLVSGNDHITAYQTAYDCKGSTRATIIGNANRLMRDSRISMQLESVLEATKQNVVESDASARRYVMQELFDSVNKAETSESGRLRALELIGKAVGMFTDRVEQVTEVIDTNELKKELESHLHLLDNVKKKVNTIQ